MTKRTKPHATTSESVLDDVLETMKEGVGHIRDEIRKIAKGKAKENGHDNASRIAFLTSKVGSIADSLRKVEAAKAKQQGGVTAEAVVAWARDQSRQERARLVRELQELDSRKSGLA